MCVSEQLVESPSHWRYQTKDWRTTLLALLSPVAFVVLLCVLQQVYEREMNRLGSFPTAEPVGHIPRCQVSGHWLGLLVS